MQIIGHRGAAGLELENTAASFSRALHIGVQIVELDVRKTKDGHLVVCHDGDMERVAGDSRKISSLTLSAIQKVELLNGSHLLELSQALDMLKSIDVIIELKDPDCARRVLHILEKRDVSKISVASFKLPELAVIRGLHPTIRLYGLEQNHPMEILQLAKMLRLDGIGLNFWLLNPLTYFLCKRANLQMYVYTVNIKFLVRLLLWLYPKVAICTDHPEWFLTPKRSGISKDKTSTKKSR